MYQKISMREALNYLQNGAVLIDVKNREEYLNNHLNNAINIPINNIVNILNIVQDKEKTIIVYCSTGKRSYKAAKSLLSLGYKNVYDLDIKK